MPTTQTRRPSSSSVILVRESYWRTLPVDRSDRTSRLYLCRSSGVVSTTSASVDRYEIIYRSTNRLYSLCRTTDHEVASARFDCLSSIIGVMFRAHHNVPHKFVTNTLQKAVNTTAQHPTWLDVHVAAFNGFVDFFRLAELTTDQVNARSSPEDCTPLHLAIMGSFVETIKTLLSRFECDSTLLDSNHNTIVHYAVLAKSNVLDYVLQCDREGRLPVRSRLLTRNSDHQTPVEVACFHRKKDNLERLLRFGLSARLLTVVNSGHLTFLDQVIDEPDTRVELTKSELDQLDLTYISQGGCPLHWALNERMVERLLRVHFHIDTPNVNGETPLMVAVKRDRPKVMLALLYSGADPNHADYSGHRPLHEAVKSGNAHFIRSLLVFDAEVNAKNVQGHTARYFAAQSPTPELITPMLDSLGANSEEEDSESEQTAATEHSTTTPVPTPFHLSPKHVALINAILEESGVSDECEASSMMISLDGGGIKGLIAIQVLIELARFLPRSVGGYFNWVAGTSTGAVLALLLAQGTSLTAVRKLYFQMKDQIMTGSRPYCKERLRSLFKSVFEDDQLRMTDLLDRFDKHVLFFATRVDRRPLVLQSFRSYRFPAGGPEQPDHSTADCLVWTAVMATSAAPTYFKSSPPYLDGGFVANNPTMDALTAYYAYRAAVRRTVNERHTATAVDPDAAVPSVLVPLRLVLSIGTGQIEPQIKDLTDIYNNLYCLRSVGLGVWREALTLAFKVPTMVEQLKSTVTNCNGHVVHRADALCAANGVAFARVNPVLSKKIALNETDDTELVKVLWEVKVYAYKQRPAMRKLAHAIHAAHRTGRTTETSNLAVNGQDRETTN